MHLLLVDLGGTHIRFAQSAGDDLTLKEKLVCAEFGSLADALRHYIEMHPVSTPLSACIAIAAPLDGDLVQMTNSPWSFSLSQLQKEFGFEEVHALNDFEAVAHAVPGLQDDKLQQIGEGQREPEGNMAVLGPGTGLGVKHLTRAQDGWQVLMGEGGHVDFAPVDDADLSLWQFLKRKQEHVAAEDVLSGRGLVEVYCARCAQEDREALFDEPAAIIEGGLRQDDVLCRQSLSHFLRLLGSFAGNLALNLNTTGGVYLCGGVVTALAEILDNSEFRSRFEAKGRFQNYVADIPTYLITEPEPGLLGALSYLKNMQN